MRRLPCLIALLLLVPRIGAAATLVTFTSEGEVVFSSFAGIVGTDRVPPAGTPYQLTVSYDPAAVTPTALSPAGSNCFQIPAAGTITLGGTAYGLSGLGFTHAQLPGSNCTPGHPETQFLLALGVPPDNPWLALNSSPFMEAWYVDALNQDGFPLLPAGDRLGFQIRNQFGSFVVRGNGDFQAVDAPEQPAPIPEPGTMTLVGLGLATAIRHARKMRHA